MLSSTSRSRPLTGLRPDAVAWAALAVLLVGAGAFFFHQTRDTTLWFDEWKWALGRRGNDLDTFLRPYNGHLSLVPIAIYRFLFATVGLDHYAPYRALVIAAHLLCVVLLFVYARRRVGSFLALLAAALILFLGPAWENILWPFQIAWLSAIAAGIAALLMLDRADRTGKLAACALVALALASSGVGVAIALGVLVEVLWRPPRRRAAWGAAAPLALYALWSVLYQDEKFRPDTFLTAPSYVVDAAAGAISAVAGLAGSFAEGDPLAWGRPLVIIAAALLFWRLARVWPPSVRVLALGTVLASFWVLTALSRGDLRGGGLFNPYEPRYVYVGAIFAVLLAVELARGVALPRRAGLLLAGAVAAAVVSNIGFMRDSAGYLRSQAQGTRAALGAMEIARPLVRPDFKSNLYFGIVSARPYFQAEEALGTPADSPAQLAAEPEKARRLADAELIRIHGVGLRPGAAGSPVGARPAVELTAGGMVTGRGACIVFRPPVYTPVLGANRVDVTVPPAGLLVSAAGGPATVRVRRFANEFQRVGSLAAGGAAALQIRPDRAPQPWHLRLVPTDRATVCGLR